MSTLTEKLRARVASIRNHDDATLLREAADELAEYEHLFELQHRRSIKADRLWREAHPGNDLVIPDLGVLLEWLIARYALREEILVAAVERANTLEDKLKEALNG